MGSTNSSLTNPIENKKPIINIIASNSRARIEETFDGRIYVVVDGVRKSASKDDLFGMNENASAWLELFLSEYDKETKKEEYNSDYQTKIKKIENKMDENRQEAEELATLQKKILKAISSTSEKLRNFLKECGVHLRSSLWGVKKDYAEGLNKEYWGLRMDRVCASNKELGLYNSNCRLQDDINHMKNNMALFNVNLEK